MGSVDLWTADYTDQVFDENIVDGDVVGNDLILTTRGGVPINAGNVRGPQGIPGTNGTNGTNAPQPVRWSNATAYAVGAIVGYAGVLWRCKTAHTNKSPSMFTSYWEQLTAINLDDWQQLDPYFTGDQITTSWEDFWKTGTNLPVVSLSSTAGEFETGKQALKIAFNGVSSQRLYEKVETIVRGGDFIEVRVRAKLASASSGHTLEMNLMQNDATGEPVVLASGAVTTSSIEGPQAVTAAWKTYTFTCVAANAKPRAMVNILANKTSAGTINLHIDRIEVRRNKTTSNIRLIEGAAAITANTWTHLSGLTQNGKRGNLLTASGGIITIQRDGWYRVGAQASFSAGGPVRCILRVIDGTNPDANILAMGEIGGSGGAWPVVSISADVPLVAGQTLRAYVYCTSSLTLDQRALWASEIP